MTTDPREPAADPTGQGPHPRWVRTALRFAVVGVTGYVTSWLVAGLLRDGYAPTQQAISELFAVGAPAVPRTLVVGGLVVSGLAFLVLAPTLDRVLPGRGRLGPVLVALAGVGTVAIVAAPCTAGCPGAGATSTDTWHVIWAGVGYGGLTSAPLAVAWRVRHADPLLARWSWRLGGVALGLFVVHLTGVVPVASGLQQRTFNTVADAWYLLVALRLLQRCVEPSPRIATPR